MAQEHQERALARVELGHEAARLRRDLDEAGPGRVEPQARMRDQLGVDLGDGGQAAGHEAGLNR